MKQLFFAAICLSFCAIGALAQTTETFGISTFQAPKGWTKSPGSNSIDLSTAVQETYCLISLFGVVRGMGTPKEDFDASWETLVKEAVNVSTAPQMLPPDAKGEWMITGGLAPFEKNGAKGVVLLLTASSQGRMVNVLILTNTQAFEAPIKAFLNSISFRKLDPFISAVPDPARTGDGYAFATSNFDDGWNSAIRNDWVEITRGDTTVLLHYGITMTDEMRVDPSNSYWNAIAANRYQIKNLYPTNYSVIKDFPYYFVQADATEKSTGKNVFVSFRVIPKNGTAYCYEIVTPTKDSFARQFPTMDKIEKLSTYNSFAIGKNDLVGTWQAGAGAFSQYYFVSSGNYAGMNITVSNLKYVFVNGASYRTEVKAVNNRVYASEKEIGKYTIGNWEVNTTDQTGKLSRFSAWFEATKGGRILHLLNKKYGGEHYQLGKDR